MNYIEAPVEYFGSQPAVFLAGGISDCENWQSQVVSGLQPVDAAVLNPRRASFPASNTPAHQQQIEWEFRHLRRANLIAFWFPPQTLCPIALFELGVCCASQTPLIVGADPNYRRRFDLEVQLELHRPQVTVTRTLTDLIDEIQHHEALRAIIT